MEHLTEAKVTAESLAEMTRYVATDTPEIMQPSPIGAWVRFDDALAAIQRERERCAKLCDSVAWSWDEQRPLAKVAHACAATIRNQ